MHKFLAATTVALLVSGAAFAQQPAAQPNAAPATTPNAAGQQPLRQTVATDLQHAGFTNIKVRADSFLVQARDKAGHPVTMIISPDSLTEFVGPAVVAGSTTTPAGDFTTVTTGDAIGSKVMGTEVHNMANQDIGSIKDILYSGTAVKAYVVGVGGFLGMGDHYVAVTPAAMHLTWDGNARKWHATMDTTEAKLKAAPAFNYPA